MRDSMGERPGKLVADKQRQVGATLKRAFPLPPSGSFGDLLAALDAVDPERSPKTSGAG